MTIMITLLAHKNKPQFYALYGIHNEVWLFFRSLESDEGMQTMESELYDDDQLSAVPRQQEMLKSVSDSWYKCQMILWIKSYVCLD